MSKSAAQKRRHKEARAAASPRPAKAPALPHAPPVSGGKRPKAQPVPEVKDCNPIWRFRFVDLDGEWGFGNATRECLLCIHARLREFETMTWNEMERPKGGRLRGRKKKRQKHIGHAMPVAKLCAAAQERLVEIEQDDVAELYRIAIGKRARLWGIRHEAELRVLWWDPGHTVYPSDE